jgi:hypothetical protein
VEWALLRMALLYDGRLSQPMRAAQLLGEFCSRFPQSQWIEQARHKKAVLEETYRLGRSAPWE